MKEISEIYSKFNLIFNTKYDDIKNTEVKYSEIIEQMNQLIVYICSYKINKNEKYKLLNELIQYFSKDGMDIDFSKVDILTKEIAKLKSENDEKNLPVIYHNIIFIIENIFKKRKKVIQSFDNDYFQFFAYCQNLKFIKQKKKNIMKKNSKKVSKF